VVGGQDDQRVVVDPEPLQAAQEPPEQPVDEAELK
jgi:hypothetical protein